MPLVHQQNTAQHSGKLGTGTCARTPRDLCRGQNVSHKSHFCTKYESGSMIYLVTMSLSSSLTSTSAVCAILCPTSSTSSQGSEIGSHKLGNSGEKKMSTYSDSPVMEKAKFSLPQHFTSFSNFTELLQFQKFCTTM